MLIQISIGIRNRSFLHMSETGISIIMFFTLTRKNNFWMTNSWDLLQNYSTYLFQDIKNFIVVFENTKIIEPYYEPIKQFDGRKQIIFRLFLSVSLSRSKSYLMSISWGEFFIVTSTTWWECETDWRSFSPNNNIVPRDISSKGD